MSGSRLRISVLPGSCSRAFGRIWLEGSGWVPEVGFSVNKATQVTPDNAFMQSTKMQKQDPAAQNSIW